MYIIENVLNIVLIWNVDS